MMMRIATLVLSLFWVILCHYAQASDLPIEEIKLPPDFRIELLARVDNAREMALGAKGTLFVGSMQAGKVYAVQLKPPGPPAVTVIASGLKMLFFFQAEDGIRDYKVTGVQTCALPI